VDQSDPGLGDPLAEKDAQKLPVADAVEGFLDTEERRVERLAVDEAVNPGVVQVAYRRWVQHTREHTRGLFVCDRLATYAEWKSGLVPPWVHRLPVLGASKRVN
jgi:hypothetical protein